MEDRNKTKISKSYRLRTEIVDAIKAGMEKHGFDNETEYLEAVLARALGVSLPKPELPKISRKAQALAA
jgi:hypothetical protein